MSFVVGDICDLEATKAAFLGVDVVIHTAAVIDTGFRKDSQKMRKINVQGGSRDNWRSLN